MVQFQETKKEQSSSEKSKLDKAVEVVSQTAKDFARGVDELVSASIFLSPLSRHAKEIAESLKKRPAAPTPETNAFIRKMMDDIESYRSASSEQLQLPAKPPAHSTATSGAACTIKK